MSSAWPGMISLEVIVIGTYALGVYNFYAIRSLFKQRDMRIRQYANLSTNPRTIEEPNFIDQLQHQDEVSLVVA